MFSINCLFDLTVFSVFYAIDSGDDELVMAGVCNDRCKLEFYKQSVRGYVRDYVISFNDNETSIEEVIDDSYDLFDKLMETFKDKMVKVRLIAKIEFAAINDGKETEVRHYHFTSYQAEFVEDRKEFFQRHMLKIASRLNEFNQNGSNLIMKRICDCHIAISIL